jgi:hypothetical protein
MKRLLVSVFVMILAGGVLVLSPVWGLQLGPVWGLQDENLSANSEMTARIQAFDPEDFTRNFDVYAAEALEAPTALLFDMKDDYHLPSRFWGKPLSQNEIIYAIGHLKEQKINAGSALTFEPRALNVVNIKGKVLGYVYTSIRSNDIVMERKEDGNVKVFPPKFFLPDTGTAGGGR